MKRTTFSRHLLPLLLSFLCLLLLLPLNASADRGPDDWYGRIRQEDGTVIITSYVFGPGGDIVIPAELDGVPVSGIADDVFEDNRNIESVTISEGITSIGDYAFSGCTSLTAVTIPDTVTKMGRGVFEGCDNLQTVRMPSGLKEISDYTFCQCFALTDVTIPDGVETIGESAFFACVSLKEIVIPDSVTSIGMRAFCQCFDLETVTMPAGAVEQGDEAFAHTPWLKAVDSLFPTSYEKAEDYRGGNWTFPEGKTVYTASDTLYEILPESIRTRDGKNADYMLVRELRKTPRDDFNGPANNMTTRMYICSRDGTVGLLYSITIAPPSFGFVQSGESLDGDIASYERIWEEIGKFFPEN